jgi:hypothetical protein
VEEANVEEIRKALRDIRTVLEAAVIGPPSTSMPVIKARYMLTLVDNRMLDPGNWWQTATRRAEEWETYTEGRMK